MSEWKRYGYVAVLLLVTSSCSTVGKSTAVGASAGGVLGAGVGALADPGPDGENRVRNVLIGTAAGGAVGAVGGFLIGKNTESDREAARLKGKKDAETEIQSRISSAPGEGLPKLIPPKTEARWTPDLVRGGTFVPGHFEYVITEPARWETGR